MTATTAPSPARSHAAVHAQLRGELARRSREMVTPEGLSLPLTIASRGARAGALILDLVIIAGGLLLLTLVLLALGFGLFADMLNRPEMEPVLEVLLVVFIIAAFLARYFYFMAFELSPRGATPGKRLVGIRVAARPIGLETGGGAAGRLTAEAVIARNLLRDVEVFLPTIYLLSGGWGEGAAGLAAGLWLAVFALFPCFNRDALRAGDLVAGTWVVEAERTRLSRALSLDVQTGYRFGPAELSVYGEHELQVLETVLRGGDATAQREVAEAICRRIGWEPGAGDERAFLEAFYAALRAHLERGLRFGRRKKDKFA